jgi:transposase
MEIKTKPAKHNISQKQRENSTQIRVFELEKDLSAAKLEASILALRTKTLENDFQSAKRNSRDQALRIEQLKNALKSAEVKIKVQSMKNSDLERTCELLRSGRSATQDLLQKEIYNRDNQILELKMKLEAANKQLEWFRKSKFKGTSEGIREPETKDQEAAPSKQTRGQKSGSKGHGRQAEPEIETDVKFLEIPGCACGSCGKPYKLMNRTEASPLTEIELNLLRTIYQRCIYVSECDCEGRKIKVAAPPQKLFARTEIGNSLWVWLIIQKFLNGMPQNRILKQLSLCGLSLGAGTVTGGYKIISELLDPLYEKLLDNCRGADLWNADETTWRIFGEEKKRWWFWLIASQDTVVYLLDPSRSKKVPEEFFAGSAGILMTDRLASYKGLHAAIRKAWCWAHIRRDIYNIYIGVPKLKAWAKAWLLEITQLYVLQHKRLALWKDGKTEGEEWKKVMEELETHLQMLRQNWESEVSKTALQKDQGKVLRSLKRHWKGLIVFLEDPRIPLDNNRAERLLRNPVILRKNSFGSGAPWAGRFAAKIFSLIQTWLINGLDPQKLLQDYFNECSKTPGIPPPNLNGYLPWKMTKEQRSKYQLPESYQQPG